MKWTLGDYRLTALQRIGEARRLKELERYSLAMYVSGVAAECMLRAFLPADARFDERHDLVEPSSSSFAPATGSGLASMRESA